MNDSVTSHQPSALRKMRRSAGGRGLKAEGRQRGVTLVELIVAVTIAVALIVSSGTLYATVIRVYIKDQINQDIQRESDGIVNQLSTNLRDAKTVNVAQSNFATNPNTLTVDVGTNQTRKYYVTGNQLHFVSEQGVDDLLLQPGTTVTSLTFTPTNITVDGQTTLKSIAVAFTLSRTKNTQITTLSTTTTIGTRPQ